MTDDFQFVFAKAIVLLADKQEALDFIGSGGNPTTIDNLEVLFEDDDAAVYINGVNDGIAMCFYTKRGDKLSHCRIVQQVA